MGLSTNSQTFDISWSVTTTAKIIFCITIFIMYKILLM